MNRKGEGELMVAFFVLIGLLVVAFLIFGIPFLRVWWAEQTGKAEYARAEQNRKITILEAEAKKDSAKLLAEAEIERAKGIAEANKIIGDSLKNNDNYLRYLWIDAINSKEHQIIYVPTESNIPIMESTRLLKQEALT